VAGGRGCVAGGLWPVAGYVGGGPWPAVRGGRARPCSWRAAWPVVWLAGRVAGRRPCGWSEGACRIGAPLFVVVVSGQTSRVEGADMAEYLIAFNGEWVPELSANELRRASAAVRALRAEMKAAGVFVFLGGLDDEAPVASVGLAEGRPIVTDGPFVETKEHLGGFTIVDVADDEAARMWAAKVAVACGWPQEVRRFQRVSSPETA
jgi:hypothetical protein